MLANSNIEAEEIWKNSHDMIIREGEMTYEAFQDSLKMSDVFVRKGFLETISTLKQFDIKTIIASCGFQNVIKATLESNNIEISSHKSLTIDAHILEFDKVDGKLIEIKPERPLHHMSKRNLHNRHPVIVSSKSDHIFAIVVGDSEGDFYILKDRDNCTVIRIGFAIDDVKAAMMREKNWCDLVIIGDENEEFHIINNILTKLFLRS